MVGPPAALAVAGYAVGDVVRLVAELLDNATAFSPPSTQVTVSCYPARAGGVSLDILDHGIGMPQEQVEASNAQLSSTAEMEPQHVPPDGLVRGRPACPPARRAGAAALRRGARRRTSDHHAAGGAAAAGERSPARRPGGRVAAVAAAEGAQRRPPRRFAGQPAQTAAAAARQGTSDGAAAGRPRAGLAGPGQRLGDLGDLAGHRGRGGRGRGGRRPRAGVGDQRRAHRRDPDRPPPPAADQVAGPPEGTPIFNQMQTGWFAEEDEKTPQKATQSWTHGRGRRHRRGHPGAGRQTHQGDRRWAAQTGAASDARTRHRVLPGTGRGGPRRASREGRADRPAERRAGT
ncbi:ATP-binding protein [Fodinicola feengrottensis]|uniref:ATP-binding protein n=1 Tax=Fodinicola feengrottensis TaxID=435914 RepID=UPI0036F41AF9